MQRGARSSDQKTNVAEFAVLDIKSEAQTALRNVRAMSDEELLEILQSGKADRENGEE